MAKTNNIIELNGKRYDAVTGAFVGAAEHDTVTRKATHHTTQHNAPRRGAVVDGIVRQNTSHPANIAPIPVKPVPEAQPPKRAATVHPLKPITAHRQEHSKTLMRHVVKAPKITSKKPMKAHSPTDVIKKQPATLTVKPKHSSDQIDADRADRAKQVARSQAVDRFYRQPHPAAYNAASHVASHPVQQARIQTNSPRTLDGVRHTSQQAPQRRSSMFEQAIATAESHEQATPKDALHHKTKRQTRKRMRIISITAATCAMLLLGGFIAFQNRASIELQVASAKAGFPAAIPGYKPSGFAFNGMTYKPGTVTVGYRSNGQSFSVVQKASNWDSQTLLENFVATNGEPYNTYQAAGRTIYIYDNGNATWVNSGVWYQLNDNAHLDSNQIINLATSM